MRLDRPAAQLLKRLDADVASAFLGHEHAVLAFSGGLGSLILAAVARKHTEITCVVVGFPGSADVQAAVLAGKFLDYPVRIVRPTATKALHTARAIRLSDSRLSALDALSLVPLFLARARYPRDSMLSGFGLTWESPSVRRFLASTTAVIPTLRASETTAIPRVRLLAIADLVGIPMSFSRASRRTPAEGSRVGPAIRALAHHQKSSVVRLLEPDR